MKLVALLGFTFVVSMSLGAPPASAQELLCCGQITCPEGTAHPTGEDDQGTEACCALDENGDFVRNGPEDTIDGQDCQDVQYLHKACDSNPGTMTARAAETNVVAGCTEQRQISCIGGAIPSGGSVKGCVCIGDWCEADVDFPFGKEACTRLAVEACCEAGACS